MCQELARQGWSEITHDVRCAGVQLDIVARSPRGTLTILEVKTHSSWAHLDGRQKARLFRAAAMLAQAEPVEVQAAFVESSRIRLLPVDSI